MNQENKNIKDNIKSKYGNILNDFIDSSDKIIRKEIREKIYNEAYNLKKTNREKYNKLIDYISNKSREESQKKKLLLIDLWLGVTKIGVKSF